MSLLRMAVSVALEAGRAPHCRVHVLRPRNDVRSLWPLSSVHADDPLFVFAYSLVDVAFEPSLFGCHLKPHDAPARTAPKRSCSLGCENGNFGAVSWPDRGETNQGGITTILGARYDPQERDSVRDGAPCSALFPHAFRSCAFGVRLFTYRYCHLVDGAVEGEGDRRRQVPVAAFILKNEACSRVGAQQLARHL